MKRRIKEKGKGNQPVITYMSLLGEEFAAPSTS